MFPTEVEQLTLFPEGTLDLASLLVLQGSEEARKMTATSGRRLSDYYKKSGPVGLLAKMLLGTSLWGSTMYSLTWKASTTPHKRLLFRLQPSTPHTDETGCSLWPTPIAGNARNGCSEGSKRIKRKLEQGWTIDLQDLVRIPSLWPTPIANDAKNATLPPSAKDWDSIPGAIMREGHTAQEGQLNPEWVEMLMCFPVGWTDVE